MMVKQMGANSKIQWCTHTLNGMRGCAKKQVVLSETDPGQGFHPSGCDNCYAEAMSFRNPALLGVWGLFGTRVLASDAMWKAPMQWDKDALAKGERHRVFCYSLGDVGEMPLLELEAHAKTFGYVPTSEQRAIVRQNQNTCDEARKRLFDVIERCTNLDFLLLTKRPEFMSDIIPAHWVKTPPANWWQGVSISTKRDAEERLPLLAKMSARVRYGSFEPLLETIDFGIDIESTTDRLGLLSCPVCSGFGCGEVPSPIGGDPVDRACYWCEGSGSFLDWGIIGGESGGGERTRDCEYAAIESLLDQFECADVFRFVKQAGRNPVDVVDGTKRRLKLADKKGGDLVELPERLRIRQLPEPRHGWLGGHSVGTLKSA